MEKITLETEVTSSELACVLGITGRNVRQLVEDGQLEKRTGASSCAIPSSGMWRSSPGKKLMTKKSGWRKRGALLM